MVFFGALTGYTMRINLSMGIVAMTSSTVHSEFPTLPWDTKTKSIVLSSYFWGYVLLQMPAGMFCQKYGPKFLLFVSILGCGLISVFTPFIANNFSWKIVVVSRVVLGAFQGFLFPCVYALAAKWSPPLERNRFFSYIFSGTQVGTIVTLLGAGFLAAGPGGWPSIFYVSGCSGILWALLWIYLGANSPEEHPFISQEEKNFIEKSLGNAVAEDTKNMKVPWLDICKSVPMWTLLFAHFCQNWGFWTLLVLMPSYLSSAFHVDIKSNGLISAVPYFMLWIFLMIFSKVADNINKKKLLSLSTAKKMWNTIGMWGAAAGLLGLTMISTKTMAIILLTASVSLNFGIFYGFLTNHLDLAPNFATVLIGITNSISNSASFMAPLTAGVIVKDESDINQWNIVFYIAAAIFIIGNVAFLIFGSAELQPWNEPKKKPNLEAAEIPLTTIIKVKQEENGIDEEKKT